MVSPGVDILGGLPKRPGGPAGWGMDFRGSRGKDVHVGGSVGKVIVLLLN